MVGINIVPTCLLERTNNQEMFMCLYQEAMASEAYAAFFRKMVKLGKFVIMDNGAAEGQNPSPIQLLNAYQMVNPSEVILPDVVGNKNETLRQGKEAIEAFKRAGFFGKSRIMAVPQGATLAEWIECLDEMLTWPIDTIGVSKFITNLYKDERPKDSCIRNTAVKAINLRSSIDIHLLGCWENALELSKVETLNPGRVRSTDSAIAYVYSRNNKLLLQGDRPDQKEIDFDRDTAGDLNMDILQSNLDAYRQICK